MLESGVNFGDYIRAAKDAGIRPHLPLYPYEKKSVAELKPYIDKEAIRAEREKRILERKPYTKAASAIE